MRTGLRSGVPQYHTLHCTSSKFQRKKKVQYQKEREPLLAIIRLLPPPSKGKSRLVQIALFPRRRRRP